MGEILGLLILSEQENIKATRVCVCMCVSSPESIPIELWPYNYVARSESTRLNEHAPCVKAFYYGCCLLRWGVRERRSLYRLLLLLSQRVHK